MKTWLDSLQEWKDRHAQAILQHDQEGAEVAARWVEYWVRRVS